MGINHKLTRGGILFCIAIAFAIFQDLPISIWAMLNGLPTQPQKYQGFSAIISFYWIKVAKYIFFILAVLTCAGDVFAYFKYSKRLQIFFVLLLIAFLPSAVVSLVNLPWQYWLAGMKASLPLLAVFVGIFFSSEDHRLMKLVLDIGIVVNLLVALMQQVHGIVMCPVPVVGCIGLLEGYRSTGTFSEPNTMAALVVARTVLNLNSEIRITQITVWGVVLALSISRSSIVLFFILMLINWPKNGRRFFYIVFPFLLGLVFLVQGRGVDGLQERWGIVSSYLHTGSWFFGNGIGAGTLSMEAVGHTFPNLQLPQFETDSMVASLLAQGGAWSLVFFWTAFAYLFYLANSEGRVVVFTFMVIGAASVVLEVWPTNIIMLSVLGLTFREHGLNRDKAKKLNMNAIAPASLR